VTRASVSVVIAALDAERFVEEAIRSALDQTVPPEVVVLVDDGSTDATAAIAESIDARVTVLRRPHEGLGPSRNAGLAVAHTEMIAFLDADDVWLPHKLERQHAAFAADPTLEAVFCLMDEFLDGDALSVGMRPPRTGQSVPLSSGALVRRALVDRLGPFDAGAVGDWVRWWARARALGITEQFVPEVLFRRRIHGRNNSLVHGDQGHTFLDIAREHLRDLRADRAARPDGGA
jgi:glycosyltransferase involved in cell wall biosynthesis